MKKEIQVDYSEGEGKFKEELKGTVVMKRLNFSDKNTLEEESATISFVGNTSHVKISTTKLKELSLLRSIVESTLLKTVYSEDKNTKALTPVTNEYPITMANIRELPFQVGEELFEEWSNLNSLSPKKKEN